MLIDNTYGDPKKFKSLIDLTRIINTSKNKYTKKLGGKLHQFNKLMLEISESEISNKNKQTILRLIRDKYKSEFLSRNEKIYELGYNYIKGRINNEISNNRKNR